MPFFPAALRPPLLIASTAFLLIAASLPLPSSAEVRQSPAEMREEQISFASCSPSFAARHCVQA